ncbi:hypothetical protein QQF64_007542 [Cirrhinus molitorella]|uniref:Fibrinogen C-terminal domain-containing protein n=1 Tax=Cirrhinus molitorella TaxID=172907 RepID=A0ABR3MAV9_9TELE
MVSDKQNDQGHWTVILRRTDDEVNFFRPWKSYKWGFGNKEHDFWHGLEFLHQLTRRHQYKLRVDLEDFEGQKAYALYESFSVDSEADGRFSITYGAPDPLSWTSEAMITNMIVLLCLSAVLMGADVAKSDFPRAKDCSDIYENGYRTSGVYTVSTLDGPVQVYCEMASGGLNDQGYWTVILRRTNDEVNFFRPWRSYKWGFGNKEGDYWLGLEFLHQLTRRHQYRLRVDLEDFQGQKAYAVYRFFSVGSEADGYKLHVSGFVNGGAGDALYYNNGLKFTTFDIGSCAKSRYGGFCLKPFTQFHRQQNLIIPERNRNGEWKGKHQEEENPGIRQTHCHPSK